MLIFYKKQVYHKRSYSWMSLGFIQKQLAEFHSIKISVSAIKWQLESLKARGLMKYYRNRCGRRADGTVYRKPSNRSVTVQGLLWLKAGGLELVGWLWDHVTRKSKLPRGKGVGDYEKKQLAARTGDHPSNGVRKLISSIGKSFSDLKLFTW